MLYVVNAERKILARFEAWSATCTEDAAEYIKNNGLTLIYSDLTFGGDMIYWVE